MITKFNADNGWARNFMYINYHHHCNRTTQVLFFVFSSPFERSENGTTRLVDWLMITQKSEFCSCASLALASVLHHVEIKRSCALRHKRWGASHRGWEGKEEWGKWSITKPCGAGFFLSAPHPRLHDTNAGFVTPNAPCLLYLCLPPVCLRQWKNEGNTVVRHASLSSRCIPRTSCVLVLAHKVQSFGLGRPLSFCRRIFYPKNLMHPSSAIHGRTATGDWYRCKLSENRNPEKEYMSIEVGFRLKDISQTQMTWSFGFNRFAGRGKEQKCRASLRPSAYTTKNWNSKGLNP